MPFQRKRPNLILTQTEKTSLEHISKSRTEKTSRVERAKMLLLYANDLTVSTIARQFRTNRPKVELCIDKAFQFGILTALDDLPRSGKPADITSDAQAWLINLACQKPKDLGYSFELWTYKLLSEHVRSHCNEADHPSLAKISKGTVSKILRKSGVRPHKITYYLEKRDPEFDSKMARVLHVYKEVEMMKQEDSSSMAVLSYDAKPGIQAIANTSPDLPSVPGEHPEIARDFEYKRLGTVSFLASIDLLNGHVLGTVEDRHRSCEFIDHLKLLDNHYPKGITIRIILDNHSAHISKETKGYLSSVPKRFEFIFTPEHGSWLNIIETLFAKMTKTFLRGIRVESKDELKERIKKWLHELNECPVIFRWKYKLDSLAAT